MHLSKKQSIKLTIAILVIFFTLSIISIKLNEEKGRQTQDINEASGEFNDFTISKNAEIILNNFERSSMKKRIPQIFDDQLEQPFVRQKNEIIARFHLLSFNSVGL